MNKMLWGWIIAAGLLLARLGYMALDAGDGTPPELAAQVTIAVLLTAGLLAGLFGITGLLGLLGWVQPAVARTEMQQRQRERP